MLKGDSFITTQRALEFLGISRYHLIRVSKKEGWEVINSIGRGNQKLYRFSDILAYIIERKGILK